MLTLKYILEAKQTPDSWYKAKIVILFKKGDNTNYRSHKPPVIQLPNI